MRGWWIVLLAVLSAACATDYRRPQEGAKLVKAHEEDARIRVQLGIQYLRRQQYAEALRVLEEARQRYPESPGPPSVLALAHEQVGDARAAETQFRRAVDLDPHDAAIRNNFGNFLCRQGRHAAALAQFQVAFEDRLYRRPAELHGNAGVCALRIPDLALAEQAFRTALRLSPEYPVALYEMARIRLERQRYRDGLAYLDRYARVRPHDAASLWLGVRLARGAADLDRELSHARDLSRDFPQSPEARWLRE